MAEKLQTMISKAWFTLATEAEAETEESLLSSVKHKNGGGRILTF